MPSVNRIHKVICPEHEQLGGVADIDILSGRGQPSRMAGIDIAVLTSELNLLNLPVIGYNVDA